MARFRKDDEIGKFSDQLDREEEDEMVDNFDDANDIDFEPEGIQENDHDSGSEVDLDPLEEEDEEVDGGSDTGGPWDALKFYIGKDGDTLWASDTIAVHSETKTKNIVQVLSGPKGPARLAKTPLECFSQIVSSQMVDDVVNYTNIYINNKRTALEAITKTEVRKRDYRETTRAEMLAVFGSLFLMGVQRGNISEFFNNNGTGLTILRANFGESRFRLLLRSLRFDNINTRVQRRTTDKLAPMREFLTNFISNCQSSYSLGECITVGEMLVAFRGRCSFVQHMAKKPAKYGLKMYALCDARTLYTCSLEIYCGLNPGPYACSSKPFELVKRLIDPFKNSNRNITANNYFSSFELAEYLLNVGLTFLGTLRKDNKEVPPCFVQENKRFVPGSYLFGCQEDKTLISLVTKKHKSVLVLSTVHNSDAVDEETGVPVQVIDYNVTKSGIDSIDLMCSRITTSRRTQRWPMNIFFRLLDIAGINSFKIFQINNPYDKSVRRMYTYNLALQLMNENLKQRAKLLCLPKDLAIFLDAYREQPPPTPPVVEPLSNQKAICYICGSKKNHRTQLFCHMCKKYVCKNHTTVICKNCRDSEGDDNVEID